MRHSENMWKDAYKRYAKTRSNPLPYAAWRCACEGNSPSPVPAPAPPKKKWTRVSASDVKVGDVVKVLGVRQNTLTGSIKAVTPPLQGKKTWEFRMTVETDNRKNPNLNFLGEDFWFACRTKVNVLR